MKRKMGKGLTILITLSMIVCGIPFPQGQTNKEKRTDVVKAETKTTEIRTVNANLGAGKEYQIAGIHDAEHIADEDVKNPYVEWSNGRGSYVYYGNYYQSDRSGKKKDPIKWCVVDASTTEYGDYSMLLQSDAVLDNVVYINDYAKKLNYSVTESDGSSVFGTTYLKREKGQDTDHLANDYQYSDMRYWLNSMKNPDGTDAWEGESTEGGFLDTAFSSEEQLGLLDSKKDALIHTRRNYDTYPGTVTYDHTRLQGDKIFIFSIEEYMKALFGEDWGSKTSAVMAANKTATAYGCEKQCWNKNQVKDTGKYYAFFWVRTRRICNSDRIGYYCIKYGGCYEGFKDYGAMNTLKTGTGTVPACNLKLSSVAFTSASNQKKADSFIQTESAENNQNWNVTMKGGSGFSASLKAGQKTLGLHAGDTIYVNVKSLGKNINKDIAYNQLSAMLLDKNGTVAAYGKVADIVDGTIQKDGTALTDIPITFPGSEELKKGGHFTLKLFAEEVNSTATQNLVDFASNSVSVSVNFIPTQGIIVSNPYDSHIVYEASEQNGAESQYLPANTVLKDIVYQAEEGYYFPEDYIQKLEGLSNGTINGITVSRDSYTKLTISGKPTQGTVISLAPATQKAEQESPQNVAGGIKKITGTTEAMEYRFVTEETTQGSWLSCTQGSTEVPAAGTYEIRKKETDALQAGKIIRIIVHEMVEFRIEPETGLVYDGTEKKGYVGTPEVVSGNYTSGEYTVTYTNAAGEQFDSAPMEAGKYTVTIAVPDDNKYYLGSSHAEFSIDKATITVKADKKRMTVGASIPKLSYSILGDFENMVSTDALQLQLSKEIDTRQPGTYSNAIHISGAVLKDGWEKNYNPVIYEPGTLVVVDKEKVELTLTPEKDIFYDGLPHKGYVGEPKVSAGGYAGNCFTITYRKSDGSLLSGMPTEVGEYEVTAAIPSDNPHYQGKVTVAFSIQKMPATPSPTPAATLVASPAHITESPAPTATAAPIPTASATVPMWEKTAAPDTTKKTENPLAPTEVLKPQKQNASLALTGKVKAAKHKVTLQWQEIDGAEGYLIYAAKCNQNEKKTKFKKIKEISSGSQVRFVHRKCAKNTWYKYRIKAYRVVNGKKVVFAEAMELHILTKGSKKITNPSGISVSQKNINLKAGEKGNIKAKVLLPKGKKTKWHIEKIRYISANPLIASVSRSGVIRAKQKGNCEIYVVTQNGIKKKVTITVTE